jgi:V/A-type H+-transporting ATPase subunit D
MKRMQDMVKIPEGLKETRRKIPGYQDAIRKVKRYMEDEESLSKASQKIMRSNLDKRKEKEEAGV